MCWTCSFMYRYCVEMAPPPRRMCQVHNCMDGDNGQSPYRTQANLLSEVLILEDMKMHTMAHLLNNRLEAKMDTRARKLARRLARKEKRTNARAPPLHAASATNQTTHTATQATPTIIPATRPASHSASQQKKKKHNMSRKFISTIKKVMEGLQAIIARLVV